MIKQKKQVILSILNENKNDYFPTKHTNRRIKNIFNYNPLVEEKNNSIPFSEKTNKIQKMKHKLEKMIDGEYMITHLLENDPSEITLMGKINRLNKKKKDYFDKTDLFYFNNKFEQTDNRVKDLDLLSYYKEDEKIIRKQDLFELDTSEISKSKNELKRINSQAIQVTDLQKEIPNHKRTRSALAEMLPYKKQMISIHNDKDNNSSHNE
jgi:hypothetical protein